MACDSPPAWFGAFGICFSHGGYPVLRGTDLALPRGEKHALVGMHNSGKSTLCRILAGLLQPSAGRIVAAGGDYTSLSAPKARELGVALVRGAPLVFGRLTVMENLVAGRGSWWLGLSPRRRYERAIGDWLSSRGIELPLDAIMGDLPREHWIVVDLLSNLYRRPQLLILDEVMEELSPSWRRLVAPLIDDMVAGGMSALWVTQRIDDALSFADRITVMRRGKSILTGRTGNLERLSLLRLCYDQLDGLDGDFADRETFQQLMRYTRAMLNDLPSAVAVLDNDMRTRFVNVRGRRLLRNSGGEGDMLFSGDVNAHLLRFVRESGDSGGELLGAPLGRDSDGVLVDVRVQPIRENGVKVGVMVVLDDVSLRESLRRQVALSDKLASIGLLAAGVAHEVNNPLEVIGNYLNYLDGEPLGPGGRKALAKMEVEVGHIQQIVRNLVAYSSRKSSGPGVDPAGLARELAGLLRVHMQPRGISFACEEPDGALALAIDPGELRQVFLNLMRNSLDALSDNGSIVFRVARDREAGMARVTITDTGGGIRLDNPNDIFLPFVTTKKDQGRHQGLGLYIVYGIVAGRSGDIVAENLPGGRGCRFTVRLPTAEGVGDLAAPPSQPAAVRGSGAGDAPPAPH